MTADLAAVLLRLEVLERLVAHRLPTCDEPGCLNKPNQAWGLCREHIEEAEAEPDSGDTEGRNGWPA